MKVLHLIASLGSGGAERQMSLLAPELVKLGVEVGVAFHSKGPNFSALEKSGVSLFQLKKKNNYDIRMIFEIWELIDKWRPDIVQTWLLQMDILGGLIALQKKIPYILSERSAGNNAVGVKGFLRDYVGVRANVIVANSIGGLECWNKKNTLGKLVLIRNAVSVVKNSIPSNTFCLDDVPLVMAAGRLCHEKNLPILISAIAQALERLPKHHALIFGEGPDRVSVEKLVEATGLSDRLHLGGYSGELTWWLKRADVFISASLVEGHPNVVIEAAAQGCPLVLSDIAAHREIADISSALLAPVFDAGALAAAVVEAVSDRTEALRRAEKAKTNVRDLRIDRISLDYLDVYSNLLNGYENIS